MRKRRKIGVRQLKNQAPRILSEIREDEAEYLVTRHGKPVALISPISPDDLDPEREEVVAATLARLVSTAKTVAAAAANISAPALVSRQRR